MSCQTSQKVPILSISKIWVHVMAFCLNVLPEALPAGQELRSAIIKKVENSNVRTHLLKNRAWRPLILFHFLTACAINNRF